MFKYPRIRKRVDKTFLFCQSLGHRCIESIYDSRVRGVINFPLNPPGIQPLMCLPSQLGWYQQRRLSFSHCWRLCNFVTNWHLQLKRDEAMDTQWYSSYVCSWEYVPTSQLASTQITLHFHTNIRWNWHLSIPVFPSGWPLLSFLLCSRQQSIFRTLLTARTNDELWFRRSIFYR